MSLLPYLEQMLEDQSTSEQKEPHVSSPLGGHQIVVGGKEEKGEER